MIADYRGKAVLVTGGTMGIGLATALAFARQGAECTLTYRFGTADEDEVRGRFAAIGAPVPHIVQADAARDDDTDALLAQMATWHGGAEAFISNVSAAPIINDIADYSLKGLEQSIAFSAWPTVRYLNKMKERFGRYPRYVVAMSSPGPDEYAKGYDYVAASKSVLETLCRYLSYRLYDEDIRINVLRSRSVMTESLRATFGGDFEEFAARFSTKRHFISPDEVGDAALALCSGLMDGLRGQVLTVDRGTSFFDNLMRLYNEREALGI
jgi:NAD(P)-dependent dehydrogenase (short-subunit alcohol dehydrogenase family)